MRAISSDQCVPVQLSLLSCSRHHRLPRSMLRRARRLWVGRDADLAGDGSLRPARVALRSRRHHRLTRGMLSRRAELRVVGDAKVTRDLLLGHGHRRWWRAATAGVEGGKRTWSLVAAPRRSDDQLRVLQTHGLRPDAAPGGRHTCPPDPDRDRPLKCRLRARAVSACAGPAFSSSAFTASPSQEQRHGLQAGEQCCAVPSVPSS